MILILKVVFGISAFLVVHTYLIYPLLIKFISLFFKKDKVLTSCNQKVSVLLSAFNEEKVIKERIENIAKLDCDFDNIEVLIGSDNSTDKTNQIISEMSLQFKWLKPFLFEKRRGKALVLNDLVAKASNDILVFTDANTFFKKDALKTLISYFNKEDIGGVSGRLQLIESEMIEKGVKEKNYWDYEIFIKKSEGRCGILIGANGGIFAIKRNLYKKIPADKPVTDDLFISLNVINKDFKFLYANESIAIEEVGQKIIHEFKRKIRFSATNFQTLVLYKSLLFNKNLLLSFSFWSHKVIRWMTPLLLIVAFLSSMFLFIWADEFRVIFFAQVLFYGLSVIGYILDKKGVSISLFSIPFYFSLANIAILIGLKNFLMKKHSIVWDSTPR